MGSRFSLKGIDVEVVGYFNDYSNLLGSDLAASGGTGTLDQFNAGEAHVAGMELLVQYDLLNAFSAQKLEPSLKFSYTYTNATFQNNFDSDDGIFGAVSDGDQIPFIAEHQWNATIAVTHNKFQFSLNNRYTDNLRTKAGQGAIPSDERIGSNFITDASLQYYHSKNWTFYSNINNLFDVAYEVSTLPAGLRPCPLYVKDGSEVYILGPVNNT